MFMYSWYVNILTMPGSIPGKGWDFFSLHRAQTGSGSAQLPSNGHRGLLPWA